MGALALALGAGCSFDSSGLGKESDSDGTTAPDTESGEATVSASGSSGTDGSDSEVASSGEPACDDPEPWYPDDDEDGYGDPTRPTRACEKPDGHVAEGDDCNDEDALVHPDADEICDTIDNDCDDEIDEWAETNDVACNGCVPEKVGSVVYYACAGDMEWSEGRALCQARGAELTSIADDDENEIVLSLLVTAGGYDYAWIGYNDQKDEGMWVWSDGTPSGFENWGMGQPASGTTADAEDCVTMLTTTGQWFDRLCDNSGFPDSKSDGVVCRDVVD